MMTTSSGILIQKTRAEYKDTVQNFHIGTKIYKFFRVFVSHVVDGNFKWVKGLI